KLLGERLLREYRAERDSLLRERAYIKQIQDLEDMRKNLEDDQPCPLCGSFDHPFARGNVPAVDETDKKIQNLEKIINKAEKLESEIESAEKENNELKNRLNQNEKLKAEAEHKAEICNKELLQGSQRLSEKIDKLDQNRKTAKDKLEAVSVSELPEKNFSEFIDSLEKRKIAWLENIAQKEKIEKEQSRLESELKSCQEVLSTLVKIQKEEKNAQAAGSNECNVLLKQRQELYQNKEPDTEQQKLENKIEKADKKLESVKNELNEINQQLAAINSSIKNLDNEIEQRKSSIEKSEAVFAQKLEQQGFSDQQSFIEARLDKAERNNLNNKFKELETLKTQNDARKKDRTIRLDELLEQKLTAESVENLNKEYDRLHAELHIVSRRAGAVKQKLDDNRSARDKLEAKAELIEKQQKELECWEKLYKLIGSADGKKYRKFAQSLTFEILVYNANQQLAKLSDRYLLLQNNDSPLELSVVDNYQAGEIRSTRNLSGGESFIVSLALALGLSQMSSQKVRVDSLFLDEGFGSLDEDSLESALATLANLHQEGKLIGVISHVTVLKDRIGMQINVVPEDGGHSRLSGPGCQRIQ
ncbi:MAG: SbcC/MukB-like Walker B domain-containing protein, partial [Candidatus Rifleibacteriota bacterium]